MSEHVAVAEIPQDERTEELLQQAANLFFVQIGVGEMGDSPDDLLEQKGYRDRIDDTRLFVAVNEAGNVIGAATLSKNKWHHENESELSDIAVEPEYRKEHIGSRLLSAVESAAKKDGSDTLRVNQLEDSTPFYLSQGFEFTPDEHYPDDIPNLIKTLQ